ncbi:MAG: hypothetical protein DKM50_12190 [Candidatus Margulisiibacteriota bacterium]|nr:MAG: hypothetical protein DKM50_12190 [Candidatus Margulisiibacteriota bacterium]HCY37353.1 hypothetical protein [Candidatus Margulisiibacteriota bacterium]
MRILITGGTGFIGRHLIERLKKNENHLITVVTRNKGGQAIAGCDIVECNLLNLDEVLNLENKYDIVYHLACIKEEKYSYNELYQANVITTKNILEVAVKWNIKQFIFASTIGVLGPTPAEGVKEDALYCPQTPYEKTKCEAEKVVLEFNKKYNLPITIIRPTMVYGVEPVWLDVFKKVKKGIPVMGSGKNYWHLVYVEDVADVLLLVLGNKKAYGQIFNIADQEPMTYENVYKAFRRGLGLPAVTTRIPIWLVNIVALFYEFVSRFSNKDPIITRSYIKRLTRQRRIDISKAQNVLEYMPKYSCIDGSTKIINEYRERGLL